MPNIQYRGNAKYDGFNNRVLFYFTEGDVEFKDIECSIPCKVLQDHFQADYHNPLPAFGANEVAIVKIAEKKIMQGQFENNTRTIFIRSEDLTP